MIFDNHNLIQNLQQTITKQNIYNTGVVSKNCSHIFQTIVKTQTSLKDFEIFFLRKISLMKIKHQNSPPRENSRNLQESCNNLFLKNYRKSEMASTLTKTLAILSNHFKIAKILFISAKISIS